jgi:hypothetical protein
MGCFLGLSAYLTENALSNSITRMALLQTLGLNSISHSVTPRALSNVDTVFKVCGRCWGDGKKLQSWFPVNIHDHLSFCSTLYKKFAYDKKSSGDIRINHLTVAVTSTYQICDTEYIYSRNEEETKPDKPTTWSSQLQSFTLYAYQLEKT